MKKRIVSIILSFALIFSGLAVFAGAEEFSKSDIFFNTAGEKIIQGLVRGIAALIPTPYSWQTEKTYRADHSVDKVERLTDFDEEADENASWSAGFDSESLQTDNWRECYVGGSLSVTKKLATEMYDDQKVRTVALSDGRGITVFASCDAFGLANSEVNKIREMLADYCKEKNIVSLNISTLHQHSCVDTYGLNGDLLYAFFAGPIRNLFGLKNPSGQNEEFMEHFYAAVVKSVKTAVENMQTGSLYYGSVDVGKYIRDKRDPQVIDPEMHRFRFVPDNEGREIWLINLAIHCVGHGAGGTVITGDYPYYMEKYINENAGADFAMIQGAQLAITSEYNEETLDIDEEISNDISERYASLAAYGKKLGEFACSVEDKEEIKPLLNIATLNYVTPTDNAVLLLAAKGGLLTNTVLRSGFGKFSVPTEISYAEFGDTLAAVFIPGELAPEIVFGGATTPTESWQNESWDFPALNTLTGERKLLAFGLTNDQIGYMLTDNSWHSFLVENEEIVSTSQNAGSTFTRNCIKLLDDVK